MTRYKELESDEIKAIINNLGPTVKKIGFTGGEIFSRSDMFEILEFCESKKLSVAMSANGTLLSPEKKERLVRLKNTFNRGFFPHTHIKKILKDLVSVIS